MKRKLFIALILLAPLSLNAEQATTRIDKVLSIYNDVWRQLDMNYVDTLNYESLVEAGIAEMLRKIDPYTVYFPKEKDTELKMMTTGKYGGIGSIIQQREQETSKGKKEKYIILANPYEGKPAQRAGVLAGDKLLSVDGVSTKGKAISEVSNMLRGVRSEEHTSELQSR